MNAYIRVFFDLSSVHDVDQRHKSLVDLSSGLESKSLQSIIMAMTDVLTDDDYVTLSRSILAKVESILGTQLQLLLSNGFL